MVMSDGGSGFNKALRKTWPHAKHQRCLFHVFSQIKRYTTTRPKTLAGIELYALQSRFFAFCVEIAGPGCWNAQI